MPDIYGADLAMDLPEALILVMEGQKGETGAQGETGPQGPAGTPGTNGTNGTDGVSPEVTITNITGGHRVTITDAEHPTGQSFDVMDGEDGVGADSVVYLGYDSQFDDDPSITIYSSNPSYATAATIAPALANTTLRSAQFEDDYTFDVYDLVGYNTTSPATLTFACVKNNVIKFCTMTGTNGKPVYSSVPILPVVTAADNGKILKVVNGQWAAVAE